MIRISTRKYKSDYNSEPKRSVFNTRDDGWFLTEEEMAAVWQLYQQSSVLVDRVTLLRQNATDGTSPHLIQHTASDAYDLDVQRNITAERIARCDAFIGAFTETSQIG